MNTIIKNRYDFIFLFDVKDGNPNGDPDQANLPRSDAENQQGLVTDVCMKRKVRNYVMLAKCKFDDNGNAHPTEGFDIFIRQDSILNNVIDGAAGEKVQDRQKSLCSEYYDIRTFG
ncbi:type I CRISPR-associated protein Cas7, partial [bacterium]|nr:type I CRISPR-associated protein Cas7 [bacterium]